MFYMIKYLILQAFTKLGYDPYMMPIHLHHNSKHDTTTSSRYFESILKSVLYFLPWDDSLDQRYNNLGWPYNVREEFL